MYITWGLLWHYIALVGYCLVGDDFNFLNKAPKASNIVQVVRSRRMKPVVIHSIHISTVQDILQQNDMQL